MFQVTNPKKITKICPVLLRFWLTAFPHLIASERLYLDPANAVSLSAAFALAAPVSQDGWGAVKEEVGPVGDDMVNGETW